MTTEPAVSENGADLSAVRNIFLWPGLTLILTNKLFLTAVL